MYDTFEKNYMRITNANMEENLKLQIEKTSFNQIEPFFGSIWLNEYHISYWY